MPPFFPHLTRSAPYSFLFPQMEYRSSMAIPSPPISIRKLPGATSNAIPTSSDRHSARSGNGNGNGNGMHPPSSKKPRLASSHAGRSSDEEASLTLPPPTSGGYNFPPVQQYRGGGGGGGGGGGSYGVSPQSPNFFPLFDTPPQSFRAPQYDQGMYQQLMRTQQQQQSQRGPAPNPFAVDWPVHASSGPGPGSNHGGGGGGGSTQGASSWNIDHFINSILSPDEVAADPNNWLDFLSGAGGLPPGPSRGGTSWERGGGGGGGGGSGGGSGSGGGGRKRTQSGSRSSSEAGRADDQDG
ncbi:hypothetical protein C8R47DRAFT_445483 [Mycena vitilis]|nr:hypothetical protein C8R47DRAFT_445483 [Mycena vitilis]